MDINLMVLNVGNSRLSTGVFVGGELQGVVRVPHSERAKWPEIIAETWGKISGMENSSIAAASVNPAVSEPLELIVSQATNRKLAWVGREIELPIQVLTENPKETGVDRVLNVAAAFEQMETACVVVDAGTAVTVDFCNENGDFVGGAIAPGIDMMLDALHEKTARLPRVKFEMPTGAAGNSTVSAIRHGVYHGIRGMVKELVENYATELGHWPELIATGGDAQTLFGGWELVHAVAPDLTLYGIALAYVEEDRRRGLSE
jgi:type III pantothenate kinase